MRARLARLGLVLLLALGWKAGAWAAPSDGKPAKAAVGKDGAKAAAGKNGAKAAAGKDGAKAARKADARAAKKADAKKSGANAPKKTAVGPSAAKPPSKSGATLTAPKAKPEKKRRDARPRAPVPAAGASDEARFPWAHVLRALTALTLFTLYQRWLRADLAAEGADGPAPILALGGAAPAGAFAAGPRALRIKSNLDASAPTDLVVTHKFGDHDDDLPSAGEIAPPSPEAAAMLAGVDTGQLPALDLTSTEPQPLPKPQAPERDAAPRGLPHALRIHFEAIPGERLAWHSSFSVFGYSEGTLGLSNARLMGVVRRTVITLLPPRVETTLRRHQHALPTITMYKVDRSRQPKLLAAGALVCLWFPFGTTFAALTAVLFLVTSRPILTVWLGPQKRRYPLAGAALADAQRTLATLTGKKALGASPAVPGLKKTG